VIGVLRVVSQIKEKELYHSCKVLVNL